MKKTIRLFVCGIILAFPATGLRALDWGVSKPPPPFDAFWAAKPKSDPNTVLLWQFDEQGELGEEALDEIEDLTDLAAPKPGADLLAGSEIKPALKGDAAPVKEGRFGGGLRLAGKGAVTGPANLPAVVRRETAGTLDFWIRPDASSAAAILVALPGPDGRSRLKLTWSPDGKVGLALGETGWLTHERPAPAGKWTHVALVLRAAGSACLLVNGTPLETGEAATRPISTALNQMGGTLWVGAGCDLELGFTGRIDSVRVTRYEHPFYELQDESLADPAAQRPLVKGPPWFVRDAPLPVSCSFDGTLAPEQFAGLEVEGAAEKGDFREGVRGAALDLTRGDAIGLSLIGYPALPLKEGSIEFWLQPIGWNNFFHGDYHGTDLPWLTLLRFAPRDCAPYRGLRVVRIAQGRTHKDFSSGLPWVPFHPGKWTHVVCAWGDGPTRVYLDGQPQPIDQVVFQGPLHALDKEEHEKWLQKTAGQDDGTYRITFPASQTLIDELRIYPYALSAEEAGNAYARFFADAPARLRELPAIRAECRYDFYTHTLTARLTCLPVGGVDPATATLRITAPDGKTVVLSDDQVALDESLRGTATARAELGFGRFTVTAESRAADGRPLKIVQTEYVREQPPWWQNTLGKDRVVPRPWTPITVEGTKLSVWGRTFTLGPGGLPASVTSAGAETFAAAPVLRATVAGADQVLFGQPVQMTDAAQDRVEWTGSLAGKHLTAQVKGTLEYDGLLGLIVTLKPAGDQPVEVTSLTLDFPLRAETARQLIVNGGGGNFRAAWDVRMIPDGTGRVWDSKTSKPSMQKGVVAGHFCPVVWIGDDDRGLCFFGENDRGWTPDNDHPAQELVREGDRVVYRMNIITQPVTIRDTREFAFYIHPTPTKPLPPLWQTYNRHVPKMPLANYEVIDAFCGFALTAAPDRPAAGLDFQIEPTGWAEAAAQREQLQDKFGKENPVLMYIDYSWPRLGPSMDDYRHSLWAGAGRMTWTREVEDYFVYWMNEYFRRGVIEGIYIDDVSLGRTFALYSTAYRMENGEIQPGFVTMGFRRFLQRMWVLFDQQGKRGRICPHMTWCFEIPALSFADATVNGEDRDIIFPAQHRYMDAWRREELRVMGNSEKWGFLTFWKSGLDYLKAPRGADTGSWMYWQSRTMFAHLTPHGLIPMWANTGHGVFAGALREFGIADPELRFIPDWKLNVLATVTPPSAAPDTLVCFYVKKDRALMLVSNYAKEDREVTVTVDPQKLFDAAAAGGLQFAEADTALRAPTPTAASAREIKAAEKTLGATDLLGDGQKPLSEDALMDELEGKDPEAKEAERLAPRVTGSAVTLVVRPQDFRLLELRPAGP